MRKHAIFALLFMAAMVFAENTSNVEFTDDIVFAVLTNAASLDFEREFGINDFGNSIFSAVEDVSPAKNLARQQWLASNSHRPRSFYYDDNWSIDLNKFQRILQFRLEKPSRENVLKAIEMLEEHPDVEHTHFNFILQLNSTEPQSIAPPNDPDFDRQYHHQLIQTLQAWALLEGRQTTTVRVGVIDGGICRWHQDLSNMLDENLHGISSTAPSGASPLEPGISPGDAHGTHIAGIIGAESNNSIGGAGIAQDVRLVAFRVMGQTNAQGVNEGMRFMVENRIPVVNISIGGPANSFLDLLRPHLNQFPGIVALSGGNDNRNYNRSHGHNFVNLITVGASNSSDNRWVESNNVGSDHCKHSMDVFAPGHNIWSTDSRGNSELNSHNRHRYWSGTSFAAPMVAATAAMMLSVNPNLTATEIREIIMETADDVPQLREFTASGRLNVYAAVKAAIDAPNRTEFSVRFNLASGEYSGDQNLLNQRVARGKNATALTANPTRDSFDFINWRPIVNLGNITENRTFVAQWRRLDLVVDCSGENFRGDWTVGGGTGTNGMYRIGDIVTNRGSFWRVISDGGFGNVINSTLGGEPGSGTAMSRIFWEEVICYNADDYNCSQCDNVPCICAITQPVCDECEKHPCICVITPPICNECEEHPCICTSETSIRPISPLIDSRFGIILEKNPVSNAAKINVVTPEPATANLRVFDLLGNLVWATDRLDSVQRLGGTSKTGSDTGYSRSMIWDLRNTAGRRVASGTYLIIVETTTINGNINRYTTQIGVKN